jgi:cell division protein FtsB|tara:strand:+ start:158 stop:1333 length:1176 start_codon:yes stop_codon:yes gene_type:complete
MFNRILKRPMFRRGGPSYGAQGTGITSGLDQPRRRYDEGEFGKLITSAKRQNVLPEDMHNTGFMRGVSTMGAYDPNNPRTIGQMIYDASSAKSKYVDPIEAAQKERELELENAPIKHAGDIEKIEKEYGLKKEIETMKNKQSTQKYFMELKKGERIKSIISTELPAALAELEKAISKEDKAAAQAKIDGLKAEKNVLERENKMLQSVSDDEWFRQRSFMETKMLNETMATLKKQYEDGVITELEWKEHNSPKGQTKIKDNLDQQEIFQRTVTFILKTPTYNKGGRVGLQNSYPGTVQEASMTETMDTPQGDMTVSETDTINQPPGPHQQGQRLTFEELRARLPREITDSVIQLLATSDEALLKFANIRTQQDVDQFNQTYQVDLVLPQAEA